MSRCSWLLFGTALIAGSLIAPAGSVHAWDEKEGRADSSSVLSGFDNPPNADRNGRGYVNPCIGHEGFEAHVSEATGLLKNDVDTLGIEILDTTLTIGAPGTGFGFWIALDPNFEVEYVQWQTACAPAEDSPLSEFEGGTRTTYWIKRPTQGSLVPNLVAEVSANLAAPDIFWPNVDPEFGWVYVTIDNDIRIAPVGNVRRSASVSNLVGSASAWVEASPSQIVFESGEPGSRATACSYESATAPYVIERATSCFYRYANSSSIATVVKDAFVTRTSMSWDITSSGPLTYSDPESWREETIQVAAVQAIEIAQ